MGKAIALAAFAALWAGAASAEPVGEFEDHADVGPVTTPGSVNFAGGAYRLSASGVDAFHYAWTQHSGDLHIAADVRFEGMGINPRIKAGPMIRQNLTPGSPYASVMVRDAGTVVLEYREAQGGPVRTIATASLNARGVRLEREGDFVYFSVSEGDGALEHAGGSVRIAFQAPYMAGLAFSGPDGNAVTFSQVELSVPPLGHVSDTGYAAQVEATLEVVDVPSGNRRVVRHFDTKIEAPNWSRDGRELIYNSGGRIWRVPVAGGEPVPVDTGRFVDNNNDHGLSPDGRLLAISDQIEPDNVSRIHVVTLDGSAPVRTLVDDPQARSYWHGWSPDGAKLAYVRVGTVDGSYDIWAKDLAGGEPHPLIVGPGVDDGPEYSPDGRYLYFNSTRSGAMALWRANADGTNPVMLTHDPARRDWFAHLSPSGTQIAYISFGDDVALEDHPPNREDVQLRILQIEGGAPPVILTRLFGGQGTINVPSWSPDGRQVAFVSYRLKR